MSEDKPKSKPYVIHVGEGVDDRLEECKSALHRLRSAIDSAVTEQETRLLQKRYVDALWSFNHCLVAMVTASDMGDCSIGVDTWSPMGFTWSKGPRYHGGMIQHGNEWSIHT